MAVGWRMSTNEDAAPIQPEPMTAEAKPVQPRTYWQPPRGTKFQDVTVSNPLVEPTIDNFPIIPEQKKSAIIKKVEDQVLKKLNEARVMRTDSYMHSLKALNGIRVRTNNLLDPLIARLAKQIDNEITLHENGEAVNLKEIEDHVSRLQRILANRVEIERETGVDLPIFEVERQQPAPRAGNTTKIGVKVGGDKGQDVSVYGEGIQGVEE